MAERKQTVQAANLQTKKRKGKIDKAHTLSGLDRAAFESAWLSLPEGVRKKCTAAELAQLVQIIPQKNAGKRRINGGAASWNRARNALQSFQNRRRRESLRLPALPPVRDYVQVLRSALTALAARLPWGKK